MNKKIKILSPYAYFEPEHAASSYLWQNLHEDFAAVGIECVVYTPKPTRGVTEEQRKSTPNLETMYGGNLRVHRFQLYREGKNPILRAARYIISSFIQSVECVFARDAKECNVIFCCSTPPILGAMCAIIKKIRKIPFVYSLQDIFPDSLVSTGLASKNGLFWKLGRVIENYTYRNADKIIVISEDFKKNLIAKGVSESKITVVYNWVDHNAVVEIPRERNKLFDKYSLDRSKFYITYNGNIGLTQNMDLLLDVASDLREYNDIHFVLVGNGAYLDDVKNIIRHRNLDNVTLLPFQPYEDISHVFSLGDVSLVISKPGVGANSVPSKTWSIMSASRPVLANFDENELKSIIEEHECGVFTKAGDVKAFTEAILKLHADRGLRSEYGKNGREFVVKHLTRDVGTKQYIDVIGSVICE
jgi:glycosyltransferase involved in cell wall biosynthesis